MKKAKIWYLGAQDPLDFFLLLINEFNQQSYSLYAPEEKPIMGSGDMG